MEIVKDDVFFQGGSTMSQYINGSVRCARNQVSRVVALVAVVAGTLMLNGTAARAQEVIQEGVPQEYHQQALPWSDSTFYPGHDAETGCINCEPEPEVSPFSAMLTLRQDIFFGFYPMLQAGYNINKRVQFTFYGLLWTTPSFSVDGTGGQGLWTEAGVGLSFLNDDRTWSINPQIGVLNGVLLSGSERAQAFEGIVPTLTINNNDTFTEAELYFGYYLATASPRQNDFVHWWANGGVKPFGDSGDWKSIFSVGTHFEQLWLARSRTASGTNIYTWLGPYVQCRFPNNLNLRLSAGWDLQGEISGSFYKASIGLSF